MVTRFQDAPPSPPSIPYRIPPGEKARDVIVGADPGPPVSVPMVVGAPLAGLIVQKAPLHVWVGLHIPPSVAVRRHIDNATRVHCNTAAIRQALGVCGLPSEVPAPVVRLTVAALIVGAPEPISHPYSVPFGANAILA